MNYSLTRIVLAWIHFCLSADVLLLQFHYKTDEDSVLVFSQAQKSWIERAFSKRECVHIIVSAKDPHR